MASSATFQGKQGTEFYFYKQRCILNIYNYLQGGSLNIYNYLQKCSRNDYLGITVIELYTIYTYLLKKIIYLLLLAEQESLALALLGSTGCHSKDPGIFCLSMGYHLGLYSECVWGFT